MLLNNKMLRIVMRPIYTFLLSIFVGSLATASSIAPVETYYTPIKNLKQYKLKDINPDRNIKYFDIKIFTSSAGDDKYKYYSGWSFDMRAYRGLIKKEQKNSVQSFHLSSRAVLQSRQMALVVSTIFSIMSIDSPR